MPGLFFEHREFMDQGPFPALLSKSIPKGRTCQASQERADDCHIDEKSLQFDRAEDVLQYVHVAVTNRDVDGSSDSILLVNRTSVASRALGSEWHPETIIRVR
jgi:hypothetical protein